MKKLVIVCAGCLILVLFYGITVHPDFILPSSLQQYSKVGNYHLNSSISSLGTTRYKDKVFTDVNLVQDLVFKTIRRDTTKNDNLLLDLYLPSNDTVKNRPAILFIHGGGFKPKPDKSQRYIVFLANEFAKRGYVSVCANYRVNENLRQDLKEAIKIAVEDTVSAVNWIREYGPIFGIDPDYIAVVGGSAGGMIGLNLAITENNSTSLSRGEDIFAFVNLWGSPPESLIMGEIKKGFPPTMLVHGTADNILPFCQSELIKKILQDNEIEYFFYPIQDGGHTPTEHMEEIIQSISSFLYTHLSIKS